VRLERVRVELRAGEVPLLGEHLGGDSLRHDLPAVVELLGETGKALDAEVRAHRDAGHALHARGDDDVEMAGLDGGRRVERRLHRGAALTIDRAGADRLGPAGDERGDPSDVQGLLSDLRHAAHLHVLDLGGIDPDPFGEAVEHLSRELVCANARERAVLAADRRTDGLDDVRVRHL
jgi:hypothetical protein